MQHEEHEWKELQNLLDVLVEVSFMVIMCNRVVIFRELLEEEDEAMLGYRKEKK